MSEVRETVNSLYGYPVEDTEARQKATENAEAIVELSEEKVSSVNGFLPDDNGAVTIKYGRTTEHAYRHASLSEYPKKITVFDNDLYTATPHVFLGKNYWPVTEYVAENFTRHGVTFSTDKHNITVKGTATTGSEFSLSPDGEELYWEIPSDFNVGDTFRIYVFGSVSENDSFFAKVRAYDAEKNYINFTQASIGAGNNYARSGSLIIQEGTKYLTFQCAYNTGKTYDNTLFPVFVKSDTEILNGIEFTDGQVEYNTESQTDDICSAPYESVVEYEQDLKDYIDYGSNSVSFDLTTIHNDMSYVSPEMFGAYADGKHDDTASIQACIDYALSNKKKVIGGNAYTTSSPIVVNGDRHNIELGEISYGGTDSAMVMSGSHNTIRVKRITAQNGTCLRLVSDVNTSYNNISIDFIYSLKNCVEYIRTTANCIQNRLQFQYMQASGEYNCIYQSPEVVLENSNMNLNNNNFIGGQLAGGKWGVYGAKGTDTYLTIQFEGVKNGIYFDGIGICSVISARYAELVTMAFDEEEPGIPQIKGQGVVFAIASAFGNYLRSDNSKTMGVQLTPPRTRLCPINIDLTAAAVEIREDDGTSTPLPKVYPGAFTVTEKLRFRNGDGIADEFMIFGNHILVKRPLFKFHKSVRSTDVGYVGDYSVTDNDDEFKIYTKFTIVDSGCVYTLPPSYDMIAFNEFTVEQQEGASCVFKDWRGTVIFDGTQYAAGTFTVSARIKDGENWDDYSNQNQVWDIYKQGELVATMPQAAE